MSTSNTYVLTLTTTIRYLSLTINFISLIIGTFGSIFNLVIFTAPQLRRNACVFYLLCANIFQLVSILFIVPTRMALDSFGSRLENESLIFCKIRYYLVLTLPELATYYLLLSTLDRYLATCESVRYRALSQLKIAHRLSALLLIVAFISNIYIPVFYTIYNGTCQVSTNEKYVLFVAAYTAIVVIIAPYILMFIFCVLTYVNMKRSKRRIEPGTNSHHQVSNVHTHSTATSHRFETHIIMIIVLQVLVSAILLSLRIGAYIYSALTMSKVKTIEERVAEGFALQLGVSLYYLNFAISFYVSTLTSKYFRDILHKRIVDYLRCHWH